MEEQNKENDIIYIYSEETEVNSEAMDICSVENGKDYIQGETDTNEEDSETHANEDESEGASSLANDISSKDSVSVFGLMLKTMVNPIEGWKAIRRNKISPDTAQRECFYPLLAVYSISKFAILAYSSRAELSEVIVDAVTSFVSFFFGYFCIIITLRHVMPKNVAQFFETDFGKTLVVMSLSSLCLFFIMTELLPMLWAILIFSPLWTVYMICRASKFIKIPEDRHLITEGLLNLIIIGMPLILEWIFGKILPI